MSYVLYAAKYQPAMPYFRFYSIMQDEGIKDMRCKGYVNFIPALVEESRRGLFHCSSFWLSDGFPWVPALGGCWYNPAIDNHLNLHPAKSGKQSNNKAKRKCSKGRRLAFLFHNVVAVDGEQILQEISGNMMNWFHGDSFYTLRIQSASPNFMSPMREGKRLMCMPLWEKIKK